MLLTVVSLAFLVVPCASQRILLGPILGIPPPQHCVKENATSQQPLVRNATFNFFNNLRREFAKGVDMFPNATDKKGPRPMYGMRYDCRLEQRAIYAINTGDTRVSDSDYVIVKSDRIVNSGFDLTTNLLTALNYWITNRGEPQSTLMFPYVLFFACAHSYTDEGGSKRLRLACVFEKKTFGFFEEGPGPCKENKDCKRFKRTECKDSLCWAPQR